MSDKGFEHIYVLCDPRTDEIRYVGKTYKTVERRLKEHLFPSALKRVNKRTSWIKSILSLGLCPTVEEVEVVASADIDESEMFYIAYFKFLGCNLVNMTPGGDGFKKGTEVSAETRAKLSASHTGVPMPPFTEEHKRNIGLSSRGRRHSQETKEMLAKLWLGRNHTEETKKKMSVSKTKIRPFVDQNGAVYQSITEAVKILGIKQGYIYRALKGGTKTFGNNFYYLHLALQENT